MTVAETFLAAVRIGANDVETVACAEVTFCAPHVRLTLTLPRVEVTDGRGGPGNSTVTRPRTEKHRVDFELRRVGQNPPRFRRMGGVERAEFPPILQGAVSNYCE